MKQATSKIKAKKLFTFTNKGIANSQPTYGGSEPTTNTSFMTANSTAIYAK